MCPHSPLFTGSFAGPERFIDGIAERVRVLGLGAPVAALLEMHRPLLGLARAGSLVLEPAIWMLFGAEHSRRMRAIVEDPAMFQRLLDRLDPHVASVNSGKEQHGRD